MIITITYGEKTYCSYNLTDPESLARLLEEVPIEEVIIAAQQFKIGELKKRASQAIYAAAPAYKQVNAALGIYDTTTSEAITAAIQAVRSQVDEKELEVISLDSLEEVLAYEVTFP
ncbi:MAG: hypothetical protein WC291_09035 [Thermodesulfovibrionales bacterium]|jgi:5-carboxymethyl-2-hydroxymuconate isomerase